MKLLLIFLLLTLNIFSLEIESKSENSVELNYNKNKISEFKLFESKNGKSFDSNFINVSPKNGKISNLKANTYYKLEANGESVSFWTLAKEPKNSKSDISFVKAKAKNIKARLYLNNADGALVLVTLGDKIDFPVDGKVYNVGQFGLSNNKIGNSYVVANIKNKEDLNLVSMKYGIYKFAIIPYNGKGESINYFTKNIKQRETHPQLPIPNQRECEYFKENVAEIKWDKVEGALHYEVTVCEDNNCNQKLLEYDGANFGEGADFKLFLENEQKKYYWKIKAVGKYNSSEYSELMVIDYNYINSAKK